MEISTYLLKILSCPITGKELIYNREDKELISIDAGLAFPIIDDIPLLLVERARKITASQKRTILKQEEASKKEVLDPA